MSLSVYANGMGFAHKGSGGKGVAPGDVCLTPPPPPAGPIPVPYVNLVSASDLAKCSTTVKIDGEPTALEDASEFSTSTGDEAGTQGGGVITHKTKGKASFTLWSFDVRVEGKGVCRHGDPLLQNTASTPPNCIDQSFVNRFKKAPGVKFGEPCDEDYKPSKHRPKITDDQYKKCMGGPCWECAKLPDNPGVWDTLIEQVNDANQYHYGTLIVVDRNRNVVHGRSERDAQGDVTKEQFTPDHQPPLVLAWLMGGCHMQASPQAFLDFMSKDTQVKQHCRKHSQSQGAQAESYARTTYPAN